MKIYLRIQNSYFHKGYKVNIHDYIQFNNLILIKILISLDNLNLISGFDFFFIYISYIIIQIFKLSTISLNIYSQNKILSNRRSQTYITFLKYPHLQQVYILLKRILIEF